MSEKKDPTSEDSPSLLEDLQIEDQNVFKITDKGPDFRGLTCFGAAALVVKTQFGLGILGLPHTFYILGVIPGLISLITLCILTTWSGVVVGHFRLRHPHTYSIGDAAEILFGPAGREFMGAAFWLFYTLAYGATVLRFLLRSTLSHLTLLAPQSGRRWVPLSVLFWARLQEP